MSSRPAKISTRVPLFALGALGLVCLALARPLAAGRTSLSVANAALLGFIEGVTEFLPVSSTGHLLVAERLLKIPKSTASDAYTVIIQLGAIAAVALVSWRRIRDVLLGLVGRSATGRRLLVNLIVAFVPAAIAGLLLDKFLEERLLKPGPVAVAWIVGGAAILLLGSRYRNARSSGRTLDELTIQHALIIGVGQSLALWPGLSRSLVTILVAIIVGYRLSAAVEFSFLLGLCTLSAAAGYSLLKDGGTVFDAYGSTAPIVGMLVAFVSAVFAVRWMVDYLNKHELSLFAYYRIGVGVITLLLLGTTLL